MKFNAKLLALLLALLMVVSAFVACDNSGDPVESGDDSFTEAPIGSDGGSDATDTPAGTDAPADETTATPDEGKVIEGDLVIAENGKVLCKVIRYDNYHETSDYVVAATDVKSAIEKATGKSVRMGSNFEKSQLDADAVEVLVGYTTNPETEEVMGKIGYGEYAVAVVGYKLVVMAYSCDGMVDAAKAAVKLINDCTKDGTISIPRDTFIKGTSVEQLNALPEYNGGRFYSEYVCGGNGNEIIIKDTNATEYSAYLAELKKAGFTEYTKTTITENQFATYTNAKYTVSAGYYDYEASTRVVIEPLAKPVGLKSDNVYKKVTEPAITMLGCGYVDSAGDTSHSGLSMVIRLEDGSFVVIDGAHNRKQKADQLVKAMREMSKTYLSSTEKMTVSEWIVTHPHNDHYDALLKHYNTIKAACNVERIIVNIISDTERSRAIPTYGQYDASGEAVNGDIGSKSSMSRWKDLYTVARSLGADLHFGRTGQVFYEPGLTMELLYTLDSYGPRLLNAVNTQSLIFKMTFSDGTVFMMTGDATGHGMEICAKMYGDYLKCDILQVSHHGAGTWNNNNGTISAYKLMQPATLLWPSTHDYVERSSTNSWNVVLYAPVTKGGQNPNYKEVYGAGMEYDAVTVNFPYAVGSSNYWKIS